VSALAHQCARYGVIVDWMSDPKLKQHCQGRCEQRLMDCVTKKTTVESIRSILIVAVHCFQHAYRTRVKYSTFSKLSTSYFS